MVVVVVVMVVVVVVVVVVAVVIVNIIVACLLVKRTSNMLVHLRDGSAKTSVRAATLKKMLQVKLSILPSHGVLTPGQPVPALTL